MKINEKSKIVFVFLAVIVAIGFISVFSYLHGRQWIDSDHSSEMILGKLLAEENALLSANWHYSTELRIVYQTIFTMPLFKLLGGFGNWALIRSLNIALNNLVLFLAYFFLAKQMKIPEKWILLCGLFLVLPQSLEYWNIVTFGGYYIFFIAQIFCGLGLYIALSEAPKERTSTVKRTRVYLIIFLFLSFILGVQGIRSLYTLFLPLLLTCLYRDKKEKFSLVMSCSALVCSCAGYAVNCLLRMRYSFEAYENMRIENLFFNLLPKLSQCVVCIAEFFGFTPGSPLLSVRGFFSIASLIGTCVLFGAVFKIFRKKEPRDKPLFLPVFFLISVVFNVFVFVIVDKPVSSRYFIPFLVLFVPLAALFFDYAGKTYVYKKRAAFVCGITLFIVVQACLNFQSLALTDSNSARKGYIQNIIDNKLDFGFATFWNANVTTELSDGRVEMAGLVSGPRTGSGASPFKLLDLLIPVKYFDPSWYEGEAFLLLTSSEWDTVRRNSSFSGRAPDYEDGEFVILRYPSAKQIYSNILGM